MDRRFVLRVSTVAGLLALSSGCMSLRSHEAKIAALGATGDPEDRFDNLVALGEDARTDPDVAADLCDRALKLAEDPFVPVRLAALRILGELAKQGIRGKEIADKLSTHASFNNERDFWCRLEAIFALSSLAERPQNKLPDESVRGEVEEALLFALKQDEPDRDVRIAAARELALLRPDEKKVVGGLVEALSDETPDVRYHVQRALVAIAGDDHGPTKQDWKRWADRQFPEGHK